MDSIFDLDHLYRTYFKMALPRCSADGERGV